MVFQSDNISRSKERVTREQNPSFFENPFHTHTLLYFFDVLDLKQTSSSSVNDNIDYE